MIKSEIASWKTILDSTKNDPRVLEAAFLSISVAVERYLTDAFLHFSTDSTSKLSKFRKIKIDSKEDLFHLIKGDSQRFVDYWSAIGRCAPIIFTKNPFSLVFSDIHINQVLTEMRATRNFLAHRSEESKDKYIRTTLSGGAYVDVGIYLLSKRKSEQHNNYDRILIRLTQIEDIFEHSDIALIVDSSI